MMSTKIMRIFLLFFACLLLVTSIRATPTAAKWSREIYIGSKGDHYYSWRIERHYPSSDYQWEDSVYFIDHAYPLKGEPSEKRHLIRLTKHTREPERDAPWHTDDLTTGTLNVQQFLAKHRVTFAYPDYHLLQEYQETYQVIPRRDGLYLARQDKEVKVQADHYSMFREPLLLGGLWQDGDVKVVEVWNSDFGLCFIAQYLARGYSGFRDRERDYYQFIIPARREALDQARRDLENTLDRDKKI